MIIPTLRITSPENYGEMIALYQQKGIKMLRVNMTRYSMDRYCHDLSVIRELAGKDLEIMADIPLPGRKYRLNTEKEIEVQKGETVTFLSEKHSATDGIEVGINEFSEGGHGGRILIGDGEVSFTVRDMTKDKIIAVADNSGIIRGKRSFAFPEKFPFLMYDEPLLYTYLEALEQIRPSKVVLSFSEDIHILDKLAERIKEKVENIVIVPKIETQTAVERCEEILDAYPEVMLGRGDLALYGGVNRFGENQERVLGMAEEKKANVIVATDILKSLYENIIPTRGELTDLYYLKSKGVRDIAASAGISADSKLFGRFCEAAKDFLKM